MLICGCTCRIKDAKIPWVKLGDDDMDFADLATQLNLNVDEWKEDGGEFTEAEARLVYYKYYLLLRQKHMNDNFTLTRCSVTEMTEYWFRAIRNVILIMHVLY